MQDMLPVTNHTRVVRVPMYGSGVICHVADESKLEQGTAEHGDTEPAAQSNSSKKKEKNKGYWKKKKQFNRGRGGRGGHQQSNEQQ